MYKFISISSTSLLLSLLLTACGGGGGSDSTQEKSENENVRAYIPTEVTDNTARSFLEKSTFGADAQAVSDLERLGIEKWIDEQLNASSAYDSKTDTHKTYLERTIYITRYLRDDGCNTADLNSSEFANITNDECAIAREAYVIEHLDDNNSVNVGISDWKYRMGFADTWFENILDGEDQLRQRMAYALSQILVISNSVETFKSRGEAYATYYDILAKNAFGNYRDLLFNVTKSPAMGLYLTSRGNKKANPETGRHPDENYAREIMQLFSIGLEQLNLDGTPILGSDGNALPTYTITDIEEMARIFTGWDATAPQIAWGSRPNLRYVYGQSDTRYASFTVPMEFTAEYHDFGSKTVLGKSIEGVGGDAELHEIIDVLVDYPSTAPFISKQLIQRLVTSNPTPAYVERVARVFRNNGSGVSGDMKAVLRAILLDEEVFKTHTDSEYFGKAKEPIMAYIQMLKAFKVEMFDTRWKESLSSNGVYVEGFYIFFYNGIASTFGQGPLMAPSVFNFYQSDFIANDDAFVTNDIVTPELQIQTAQIMINYSNKIRETTDHHEKLKLSNQPRAQHYFNRFLINFEEEVSYMKSFLAHNTDGTVDYNSLSEDEGKVAIDALVDRLNDKLVCGKMNEAEVAYLKDYLFNKGYGKNYTALLTIVHNAVNAIATSKSYMIQK